MSTGPFPPRDISSRALPRFSHARRNPPSKHSARKAKTSNTVDFPLPLGPSSTVSGVKCVNSTSLKARKFRTLRRSIRGGAPPFIVIALIPPIFPTDCSSWNGSAASTLALCSGRDCKQTQWWTSAWAIHRYCVKWNSPGASGIHNAPEPRTWHPPKDRGSLTPRELSHCAP